MHVGISTTLVAGHPGQGISIALFSSWSVDNSKIILLHLRQPSGYLALGFSKLLSSASMNHDLFLAGTDGQGNMV